MLSELYSAWTGKPPEDSLTTFLRKAQWLWCNSTHPWWNLFRSASDWFHSFYFTVTGKKIVQQNRDLLSRAEREYSRTKTYSHAQTNRTNQKNRASSISFAFIIFAHWSLRWTCRRIGFESQCWLVDFAICIAIYFGQKKQNREDRRRNGIERKGAIEHTIKNRADHDVLDENREQHDHRAKITWVFDKWALRIGKMIQAENVQYNNSSSSSQRDKISAAINKFTLFFQQMTQDSLSRMASRVKFLFAWFWFRKSSAMLWPRLEWEKILPGSSMQRLELF